MSFAMGFLVAIFSVIVISFLGYMAKKILELKFEKEVSELMSKVRTMEIERKNSCLVLFPDNQDQVKFFRKMLNKGIVRENPLSTGGYIVNDSFKQVWKDFAGFGKSDVVHARSPK